MTPHDFWRLEHLSDRQLLQSLGGVLRTQRHALATLIAHLGEVEERRLHLKAAHGSLFDYCVSRLGMSEDEACRRIELARLARRFPALFPLVASGELSLSVALVLKPVLSEANHLELLACAKGKSIRQARELVATRFPRPDVASSIRKLPERHVAAVDAGPPAPSSNRALFAPSSSDPSAAAELSQRHPALQPVPTLQSGKAIQQQPPPDAQMISRAPAPTPDAPAPNAPIPKPPAPPTGVLRLASQPQHSSKIDPLSTQRYRIQFTADAALKGKLELARDLLRHAHPNGDFAPILSRALDLLVADLLRRRFGAGARRENVGKPPNQAAIPSRVSATTTASAPAAAPAATSAAAATTAAAPAAAATSAAAAAAAPAATSAAAAATTAAAPVSSTAAASAAAVATAAASSTASSAAEVPPFARARRAARRAVLERDGLRCAWVDATGHRCSSRAWLEIDHRHPRGKGGGSEAENLRMLCRAHNQFAAEREYGRAHIERAAAARRRQCDGIAGTAAANGPAPT